MLYIMYTYALYMREKKFTVFIYYKNDYGFKLKF